MEPTFGPFDEGDFDSLTADPSNGLHEGSVVDAEHNAAHYTSSPAYPMPPDAINQFFGAEIMDHSLTNGFAESPNEVVDLDTLIAMPLDPFEHLERDTRIMVTLVQSIMELLCALLSVNSLHRCSENGGMSTSDVQKSCATAMLSLKATLLPLLTQLRTQDTWSRPWSHAYFSADQEPDVRKRAAYVALDEAVQLGLGVEEAVGRCEASKWFTAATHDGSGALDGGAWRASDALSVLVRISADVLAVRGRGTAGGDGWWRLYICYDPANP